MQNLKRIDTNKITDTSFYVSDGKNIIYIEKNKLSDSYRVTSVHKPNTRIGTGFLLNEYTTTATLLNNLELYLKSYAPSWATERDLQEVEKYTNMEEWLNYERKFWGDKIFINDFRLNLVK